MKQLLSGNEAIAQGAFEAGVSLAAGYPGTPSTEILESLVRHADQVHCEWSPNEKVALEVAAGAAFSGARAIATMKHVGLNVAADPLMTLAYTGTVGGLVVCVADDPGMHSSQNEQDTRHYARLGKVPILEPSDSQEARDFLLTGMEISERFQTPVILRTTTRVSHSRSLVELGERRPRTTDGFPKDPSRFVAIPLFARPMRGRLERRIESLRAEVERSPANRIEPGSGRLGIIAEGIAYQYVREVFPEAPVLKLGWAYPFPDALFRRFAGQVERILVVEELEDFTEEHVRSLGIACEGKSLVPRIGELSPQALWPARNYFSREGILAASAAPAAERREPRETAAGDDRLAATPDPIAELPARSPVLCAGCPHRGIFHALGKLDVVVTGDIGCYSLGALPPLSRLDTLVCMGSSVSMAHGMDKAHEPRRVVGIIGDSTFFHSGITALLDIAYNRGRSTIIVADNRTTAMTGHQEHPGTGRTLDGSETREASIEAIGRACGIPNVVTVDPYDLEHTSETLRQAVASEEPWLIVSKQPCALKRHERLGPPRQLEAGVCRECGLCLQLGCPALESDGAAPRVNALLCAGCGMCQQVCPAGAFRVQDGPGAEQRHGKP
jgi:indolepyruvate ferredoxin oxidoreductase alpha subunit